MASLKLKLVIDKRENRVLFAEADKDFVDFIFHILCLPLSSITRILSSADGSGTAMPGCLGSLYEGLKVLDDSCIDPIVKERFLKYKAPFFCASALQLLPEASLPSIRGFWQCPNKTTAIRLSDNEKQRPSDYCCSCRGYCLREVCLHGSQPDLAVVKGGDEGGYVKPQAMFMVMDDLVVKPPSVVSALSLIGPKDLLDIESREVEFSRDEALKLLKASMHSKTVLTDVFLNDSTSIKTEPSSSCVN